MGTKKTITLEVNGRRCQEEVDLRMLLVDFIRDALGLTGTHIGCTYEGRCGACTVVLDGEAVKSCLLLAVQADGARLLTIEGLSANGLHPIAEAFWNRHALQCGYCTPGMLAAAYDIIKNQLATNEDEVRRHLIGNLCRCTGYSHIVEAVITAARELADAPQDVRAAAFPY